MCLESKLMFVPVLRLPLLRTLLLARVAAVLRAASLFVVLHPTRPTSTGVSNFRRLGGGKGAMFCLNCCCCVVASCAALLRSLRFALCALTKGQTHILAFKHCLYHVIYSPLFYLFASIPSKGWLI